MSEKTLPERMREAGETLDEATARRRQDTTDGVMSTVWRGCDLRAYASQWEYEDKPKPNTLGTVHVRSYGDHVTVFVERPDGGVVAVYVSDRYKDSGGYVVQPLVALPSDVELKVWSPE